MSDIVVIDPPANAPIVVISPPASPDVVLVSPPGPPGPPGGSLPALSYTLVAVSSWTHVHAFPYPPSVHVVDGLLSVLCTVEYVDTTHVHISFPAPFTGTVVLS